MTTEPAVRDPLGVNDGDIDSGIRKEILEVLSEIESTHEVRILYACESGSRAWGFASPDSDYDVRFLYINDRDWYLSFDVERQRDVIELPIEADLDCNGWNLRKALHLFSRTNGALLEWLNSPIRYLERGDAAESLRQLAPNTFNPTALCYHYSHMAKRNAREYLFEDQVRLKKYFYVLRPLLAIRHVESGRGLPPVRFAALVDAVAPVAIRPGIATLLEQKRVTSEMGYGAPIPQLGRFIETELARHGESFSGLARPDMLQSETLRARLNGIFRDAVSSSAE